MEAMVALLFDVVITIFSFLFSSSPCCLRLLAVSSLWISSLYRTEHILKYSSIEKFMKLPPTCGHSSKTEFKQESYVHFTLALHAVQN
jgi:hypothetical protein